MFSGACPHHITKAMLRSKLWCLCHDKFSHPTLVGASIGCAMPRHRTSDSFCNESEVRQNSQNVRILDTRKHSFSSKRWPKCLTFTQKPPNYRLNCNNCYSECENSKWFTACNLCVRSCTRLNTNLIDLLFLYFSIIQCCWTHKQKQKKTDPPLLEKNPETWFEATVSCTPKTWS